MAPEPWSGERIGCGYCFHTLDPADRQPRQRSVIRCTTCGQLYHAACWSGRCAMPGCRGTDTASVSMAPPRPLDGRRRLATGFVGGGYTSLEDRPLGRSIDTLSLNDSDAHELLLRNNAGIPLDIERLLNPPWITAYLDEDPDNKVAETLRMNPGDEWRLLIKAQAFRPPRGSTLVNLCGETALELVTTQNRGVYYLGLAAFVILLLNHWIDFGRLLTPTHSVWPAAFSLALIIGYVAVIAPATARLVFLRLLRFIDHLDPHLDVEWLTEPAKRFLVVEEGAPGTAPARPWVRGLLAALLAAVVSVPLFWLLQLLTAWFLPALLVFLLYAGTTLWLGSRWLGGYEPDLVKSLQSIFHQLLSKG